MGQYQYAVTITKTESATIHLEAADATEAEAAAIIEAEVDWHPDSESLQVDHVEELAS